MTCRRDGEGVEGVSVGSASVAGRPRPVQPGGAAVLGWLAHPATLLGLLVLVANDHVGKPAYPGLVTGKLSDIAGLVVAPPLLATAMVLLAPRLSGHAAALSAVIATGVGFTAVKLARRSARYSASRFAVRDDDDDTAIGRPAVPKYGREVNRKVPVDHS